MRDSNQVPHVAATSPNNDALVQHERTVGCLGLKTGVRKPPMFRTYVINFGRRQGGEVRESTQVNEMATRDASLSGGAAAFFRWLSDDGVHVKSDLQRYFYGVSRARYVLRKVFRLIDEEARRHGLEPLQHQTLIQIVGAESEPLRVNEIAERMDIQAGSCIPHCPGPRIDGSS